MSRQLEQVEFGRACQVMRERLLRQIELAEREIERLRKLLKSHGQHKPWCRLSEHIDAECDCGIKAALAAGGEK